MKFKREGQQKRNGETAPTYKKQQSYHYSAKRSNADRLYGRREITDEDAVRAHTGMSRLQKLPIYLSVFLVLAGMLYLVHLSSHVSIVTIGKNGFIGDKSALQSEADDYMKSSLANRSKLSFDSAKLEDKLTADFPEFNSVEVKKYIFRKNVEVTVEFARPSAILTNGSNVYIISNQGVVLADITHDKPKFDTSNLPLVQDDSGVEIKTGAVALTSDQIKYIQDVVFQTKRKKLNVQTMTLAAGGGELDVRFGGLGYYVKFNFYEDARKSSGTFLAAKADLEKRGITPAQYIDVRIPERAYVK